MEISRHFGNVQLYEFVVMPNHLHGIVVITANHNEFTCRGEVTSPVGREMGGETPPLQKPKPTLGKIVAYYKYQTAKLINQFCRTPGLPVWQRNYYEHVIRSEKSLNKIRQYIMDNPLNWHLDIENPATLSHPDARRVKENFWRELA